VVWGGRGRGGAGIPISPPEWAGTRTLQRQASVWWVRGGSWWCVVTGAVLWGPCVLSVRRPRQRGGGNRPAEAPGGGEVRLARLERSSSKGGPAGGGSEPETGARSGARGRTRPAPAAAWMFFPDAPPPHFRGSFCRPCPGSDEQFSLPVSLSQFFGDQHGTNRRVQNQRGSGTAPGRKHDGRRQPT